MASFEIAHALTAKNEGLYANNPKDRGGETYRGVARNSWRNPEIWSYVDQVKSQLGPVPRYGSGEYKVYVRILNQRLSSIPQLQKNIDKLYEDKFWNVNNLGKINDQRLANRLFDMGVNSGTGTAARMARQAVGLGGKGGLDSGVVKLINSSDPTKIFMVMNASMASHYQSIVAKNPSQSGFLSGWLGRIGSSVKDFFGLSKSPTMGSSKERLGVIQTISKPQVQLDLLGHIEMTVSHMTKR